MKDRVIVKLNHKSELVIDDVVSYTLPDGYNCNMGLSWVPMKGYKYSHTEMIDVEIGFRNPKARGWESRCVATIERDNYLKGIAIRAKAVRDMFDYQGWDGVNYKY